MGGQFWTPIPQLRGSKLHAETQTGRIWGAVTKFNVSVSFAEKAYAFWEPIFKRAGPRVKMLTRISDPEM